MDDKKTMRDVFLLFGGSLDRFLRYMVYLILLYVRGVPAQENLLNM